MQPGHPSWPQGQPPGSGHYPRPDSGRYTPPSGQYPTPGSGRYAQPPQPGQTGPASLRQVLAAGPLGAHMLPGSVLGPYVVEKELGRGAMGVVLKALDRSLGRQVALKILIDGVDANERTRKRFVREAKVADTTHPGVVKTLDAGEIDGLLYIALEYVEGSPLTDVLQDASAERVVELVRQVAEALAPGHGEGVIHRDLKPDNVLVRREDGRPKIADFGLARDLNVSSSLTKTGGILGTPAYMAPEQIKGKPTSPASDVWALGVILYEGLTKQLPFKGGNLALQYASMLSKPPAPPSSLDPTVPNWVDGVCLKALQTKQEDRYPDAGAFAEALRDQTQEDLPSRGGQRWLLVALGALVLCAAGLVLLLSNSNPTPEAEPQAPPPEVAESKADPPPVTNKGITAERLAQVEAIADPKARLAAARAAWSAHPREARLATIVEDLTPWIERTGLKPWPPPRDGHRGGVTYDPIRRSMLMFGGWLAKRPFHRDLWAWNGEQWRHLSKKAKKKPKPRFAHAATWDGARNELLVHSGVIGPGAKRDGHLWGWSGTWKLRLRRTKKNKKKIPPPVSHHGLVYDPQGRRVLMFGGQDAKGRVYNDLWSWNGKGWRRVKAPKPSRPTPRIAFGMAYDPQRQAVVLFGGWSRKGVLNDLWTWSEQTGWRRHPMGSGLWPRARQSMGFVHTGRRILMFGGGDSKRTYGDTWSFDGDRWSRLHPITRPPPVLWHAMTFDPQRKVVVVFGGMTQRRPKEIRVGTLWEWSEPQQR